MDRIPFTGFDGFLLTLEKHYSKLGSEGNVCRYVIDLDGSLSQEELQKLLDSNLSLDTLNNLVAVKPNPILVPYWKSTQKKGKLRVIHCESDSLIPEEVSSSKIGPASTLLSFNLVTRSNGSTTLIFSWHHLLMDGFGAALLLTQIFNGEESQANLKGNEAPKFTLKTFLQAAKAKFFIDKSSKSPITSLISKNFTLSGNGTIRVIQFNEDEVKQIDQSALSSGAKFGRSAFYLACCSRAVKAILEKRGERLDNFWIPVPMDDRRKGASGPIVGNRLSFLFYRIKGSSLKTINSGVDSINNQMKHQISSGIPKAYNHLMNYIKWLPLKLYLYLVKRRSGNSIASFLFTVAASHPKEFVKVGEHNIINALSLPANPCPPGLTFAFMKFQNSLQLMMLFHPEAISEDEMKYLQEHLKYELITGQDKEYE